jgi:hypothetical protein
MKIINMATYTITTQANSVDITKDGETREYPFNELIVQVDDLDVDTLTLFNKRSLIIDYYIYTTTDTIDVNGVTVFADAEALKTEIDLAIFKVELAPTGAGTYIYRLAGTCGNITLQGFVMNSTASSTGIYTHTGTSVANNCKILDCIINDYNNITLSIAADGNPTTGFQVKRNSMYSTGDFSTYFRNCLDLDFIGNIFRADGTGVVRGFRSDVGCGGTMNINSNTMFGKNSLTGWILDVLAVIDDAGAIVNINGNTIDAGSRAIQVTGGTVTNSIELNIKGNYIKDLDSTIDAKEYIDGGVCEYNVIESDSNVGIGLPSDYTFTGGYSLRNMTIRYNKIRATKAAAHGILFGELSSGNNCYDNIIDVS